MKNVKRVLALILAAGMLAGCKGKDVSTPASASVSVSEETSVSEVTETSEEASVEASAEVSTETSVSEPEPEPSQETAFEVPAACYLEPRAVNDSESFSGMRGLTAVELVAELKAGWNLGNTMDAKGGETAWGNPKTTHEMIDAIAAKGFNVIRIPTSWGQFTKGANGDYLIQTSWLERVAEIVDYALDNDMYVILNTHHETSWIIPTEAKMGDAEDKFICIWTQIATYFANYGDHLIFEGLNEPRVEGGPEEWNGGTKENREIINRLEADFVSVVRATGGNNEKRLLLVTSEAASVVDNALKDVVVPDDEYVGLSLHAYTPYDFTFSHSGDYDNWDGTHRSDISWAMKQCESYFIEKGIPVVMTEFGAVRKGPDDVDNNDEEVVKWITDYVKFAKKRGIPCVLWDNGITNGSGERFGYFNRKNLTWDRESIVDAMIEMAYSESEE